MMLQVPISPFKIEGNSSKQQGTERLPAEAEISRLREQLLEEFNQKNPSLKKISEIVMADKEGLPLSGELLKSDYELLRDFIENHQRQEKLNQQEKKLEKEKELLLAMSIKAVSCKGLKSYLQAQLKHYEQQLKAVMRSPKEIEVELKSIQCRAIAQACLHAAVSGNLPLLCDLLTDGAKILPEELVQKLECKAAWLFANQQAQYLWEQGQQLFPGAFEQAIAWAHEHNQESHATLREYITLLLKGYEQDYKKKNSLAQAELLRKLAHSSVREALVLLLEQQLLDANLLARYTKVCATLGESAKYPDVSLFLKLYFSATQPEIWQAYKHGKISSKEYLSACAAELLRKAGNGNLSEEIYCKNIEHQLKEKGFSSSQIYRLQYALIMAVEPEAVWKVIKNLLSK